MPHAYQFHPQLILRTPSRPFDGHIGEHTIEGLLHDLPFLEALYLASPVLWAECQKWQRGELTDARRLDKLRRSLTRYYVRATTRCTPFGLFAGCAPVAWGAASQAVLAQYQPLCLRRRIPVRGIPIPRCRTGEPAERRGSGPARGPGAASR